ncbi:N-acetylmuramoyl-L-alanine amidase [Pseudonocardia nematodicida]|uniref:N-acetylmuramoyl-L-alanine amidase n=1 Tax=Pseudonocardia nematodicida TaxID=1206997 RepID=A0ABV1KKE3_9PSEU
MSDARGLLRVTRRGVLTTGLAAGAGLVVPAFAGRAAAGELEPPTPPGSATRAGSAARTGADGVPGPAAGAGGRAEAVRAPYIARCFEWGARKPKFPPKIWDRRPIRILVHHTAGPNTGDFSVGQAHRMARGIQNFHMDRNGWLDSGQHFTISRGGHIMEGRLWSLGELNGGRRVVEGAHSPGQNVIAIGIENEGTYTGVDPTPALWNSLRATCAYICHRYGIAPSELYGHRDYRNTLCPGDRLYGMLPRLRTEVAGLLNRRLSRSEAVKASWPLLREGDTGPLVQAAQYLLRDAGTLRGNADGRFDERTVTAVTEFQTAHRADDANGLLGGESWPELARTVQAGREGDAARAVEVLARYRKTESVPDVVDHPAWQRLLGTAGSPVPAAEDPPGVLDR